METFYIDMGVSVVITLLRSLKGPEKKAKLKAVFLKINNLIAGVYGDDNAFKQAWKADE